MNIANITVDIGNTRIKYGMVLPDGTEEFHALPIPPKKEQLDPLAAVSPLPVTWWIAPTGTFPCQELQAKILKVRPNDQFKILTRLHIPLKVNVDFPEKVGIDRLLAAFAATEKFGDSPMLIIDAGTAITVDVVQDQTFYGGAILPGLAILSETYPKISGKLPLVSVADSFLKTQPLYPGKNTEDAILNGLYWGTIGAIRQFYEMRFPQRENARLILTGGDAEYLFPGLTQVLPAQQIEYVEGLVWQGIKRCIEE